MCSGVIKESRRTGKLKRKNACSSDFDYKGWYLYAMRRETLKRNLGKETSNREMNRNCYFNCLHPSECIWYPERHAQRIRDNVFSDGNTAMDSETEESMEESHEKSGELLRSTSQRVNEIMSGSPTPGILVQHPNPLASMPTIPIGASENMLEDPLAAVRQVSPASEDRVSPSSGFTRTKDSNSPKSLSKSIAQGAARRKARQKGKITSRLSPISEEFQSSKSYKQVSRLLSFSNHLDHSLKSEETDSESSDTNRGDNKDKVISISRPVLKFSDHFNSFLKSQQSNCDSFPASKSLHHAREVGKMDLDGLGPPLISQNCATSHSSRRNDRIDSNALSSPAQETGMVPVVSDCDSSMEDDGIAPTSPNSQTWDWTRGCTGMALSEPLWIKDDTWGRKMDLDYSVW